MIDPDREYLLSLTEASKKCPVRRVGKRPHISCIYRWTTKGCRGVVLESIQVGGTRCTSKEALSRFFARLTESHGLNPTVASSKDANCGDALERELDVAGI